MLTRSAGSASISELAAYPALCGAVLASVADFGELWAANAGRPELQLPVPPPWVIVAASLLGAVTIPLYGLGYYARAAEAWARAPRRAAAVAVGGGAFAVLGGTVHAATGLLIWSRFGPIAGGHEPLQGILASGPILLSLWALASVSLSIAAACEAALPQPPWRRLVNPLVLTVLLASGGSLLPLPWRDFVAPASVNIAHAIFFATVARRVATRVSS